MTNFCEDRLVVTISGHSTDSKVLDGSIFDPFLLSQKYRGLTVSHSLPNTFLYDSVNLERISCLVPRCNDFHKFLLTYLGYSIPSTINFILLQESKVLANLSQEVSDQPTKHGIDPSRCIVYSAFSNNLDDDLLKIKESIGKLVLTCNNVLTNNKAEFSSKSVLGQLIYFLAEFSDFVQRKRFIKISTARLEQVKNLSDQEDSASTIFTIIYNKVGWKNFSLYIKYLLKNPSTSLDASIKLFYMDDITNWIKDTT